MIVFLFCKPGLRNTKEVGIFATGSKVTKDCSFQNDLITAKGISNYEFFQLLSIHCLLSLQLSLPLPGR